MLNQFIKASLSLILFLSIPDFAIGQLHFDAKVLMKDGSEKTGHVKAKRSLNVTKNVQMFNRDTKEVMFATSPDGPYKAIPSTKIKELILSKGEHIISLKYMSYKIQMGKGPLKLKEYKEPNWFIFVNECQNIEVFEAFSQVGVMGDNLIINPDISYHGASHEPGMLMKRPREQKASIISRYLDTKEPDSYGPKTFHKMNRKLFAYYFQNDKKVLGLIGDKKINPNNIQNIMDKICVELK